MTAKPHLPVPPEPSAGKTPPAHPDTALESLGKAVSDAVWESSGEADRSAQGEQRRAASHPAPCDQSPDPKPNT